MTDFVLVALGSNLPGARGCLPADNCTAALDALRAEPDLRFCAVSHWYRTVPVPASDQPDYVNGVARFASTLAPAALLALLGRVEAAAGRTRSVPNAARVLDLDLLAVGDTVLQTPTLTLPHPRLHERAFVLFPLCDVAPEWRHPLLGQTAAQLRDAIPSDGIERL